ncbi:MAG TPA: TonB-dependent receptor [Candidatus Acidoferrum sp.]
MKSSRFGKVVFAILLVCLFVSANAWAQTGTSGITGTVIDPQGKAVPGAKVTITNVATNAARSTQSSDTGAYLFDLIAPGDYRLEVEAKGFRKTVVDNVRALIGKPTESNVRLELGQISQVVEVRMSAQDVVINTQDASLGNVFDSSQISQLPLEGHTLGDLLSLQPGATQEGYVTGARADQSNVTLDGVDINNAQTGNAVRASGNSGTGGPIVGSLSTKDITEGPVLRLNSEAIEEFRVTTANGNANQGRSAGAQINLVTKSGSNAWHGAAFEFYRGTLFEANDWFSNASGTPRTALVRNSFGGALGGPVVKNRLFFFYSYEALRDARATGVTEIVPLPSLGKGIINYTYCPDAACATTPQASLNPTQNQAVYQAAGINPAALAALAAAAAKYPANDTTAGDQLNTGGFRFNSPTPTRLNSHIARLDYTLTSNQNLFVRANYINDTQLASRFFPDTASPGVWSHPRGLAVGHTWTLGRNWVNSARYGYTRQAFTNGGDSNGNDISFRFVFQPNNQSHSLSRITPVHNITDDVSWIHGKHTFQFGANVRLISNSRVSFANAFDNAITNPSFYFGGAGARVSDDFQNYLTANNLPGGQAGQSLNSISEVQNAATAIIGRFSQYTANFTFNKDGSLTTPGTATTRDFATQAYEEYIQDAWKIRSHLTLTLGLRYSLERPVYEKKGFEVQPGILQSSGTCQTTSMSAYFQSRLAAAAQGNNFTDPICVSPSGPANGGKPMYNWDKNNFQPRIALAWSPNYSQGLLHSLFGDSGKSVLRGGFALTNDYYGQALAVDWDLNNTLGFSSNFTTPANTFDTVPSATHPLAPLFTGFNQNVRSLPKVVVPGSLVFPLFQPSDFSGRIEQNVDSNLNAPAEYVWNLTYERQMRAGTTLSVSYIGRMARHLLARRDATAFNDVRDPKSGMDWYTAATMLEKQRQQGLDTSQIATIPFFENLFPAGMATIFNSAFGLDPVCSASDPSPGFNPTWSNTQFFYAMQSRTPTNPCAFFPGNDWTDTEALVDQVANGNFGTTPFPTRFEQPQYGAVSAWSTIGNSNYHALTVSLHQRLSSLTLDVNYSFSHSLDDSSGLQFEGAYGSTNNGGPFIENPIRQRSSYGNSDFDIRHLINASAVWQMPFGKGKALLNTSNRALDAVVGGWQLSGIFRWNTGLPSGSPFDDARWATNWNAQANVTPTAPFHTCPSRIGTPTSAGGTGAPKLFGDSGCDIKAIYRSFRNAYPGETGPRNYIRLPGYTNLDLGLGKTLNMPWSEKQHLQLRWDVFNVANQQTFGLIDLSRTGIGVVRDPALRGSNPPRNWSNFTAIQGSPRVMQVGVRFSF